MAKKKNVNYGKQGTSDFQYRKAYFDKHNGILGSNIYICSYCGRPVQKKNTHVDHIMPKSKSQFLFNREHNLTVSCAKCNLKKSDKIDHRVVQGYVSRWTGGLVGAIMGLVFLPVRLVFGAGSSIVQGLFQGSVNLVTGAIEFFLKTIQRTLVLALNIIFTNPLITIAFIWIAFRMFAQ